MTVKKLRYLAFALTAVAFCACQKEPSTSSLHKDYLVYTAHDTDADFAAFDTYYIPDSTLLIGCALAEGTAIFGFITALLILFMK